MFSNKQKDKYCSYLEEIINLLTPLNIDTSTQQTLMKKIDTTELIVPVVGGVS